MKTVLWRIKWLWSGVHCWLHTRHWQTGYCEHPGCRNAGEPCYLMYSDEYNGAPDHFYCDAHMAIEGFCRGCGHFQAGVESFDFYYAYDGYEGFCENCSDQLRHELDEDDYDPDYDPFEEEEASDEAL